jgi:hypothetical protein
MRPLNLIATAILACSLCALISGCNREDPIKAYQAPADPTHSHHDHIEWTLPADWIEWPGEGNTEVGFTLDDQSPSLDLTLSYLERKTPSAADLTANVNRWQRQVGLPASSKEEVNQLVTKIEADGRTINVVDLLGPPGKDQKRILAAMFIDGDKVWYFKSIGPADRLAPHKKEFQEFISSLKINGPKDTGPQRETKGDLSWITPPTWENGGERQMRHLTFYAGDASDPAEITVSTLGSKFGDMLENINRWRAQVGLPPIAKPEDNPPQPIKLAGREAAFFDITGPGNPQSPNRRMLLVMSVVNNDVWFFKMLGPQETIKTEKQNFDDFIKSVEFATGAQK